MSAALLFAPSARAADVVTLPPKPTAEDFTKAREALKKGSVIAMINASPAEFASEFHTHIPLTKKNPEIPLRYCVIAARRKPNGVMHTYVGPRLMPGLTNFANCTMNLQQWAAKASKDDQKTTGGLLGATPVLGDGAPGTAAYTELSMTTMNAADSANNWIQETVGIYRANSSNSEVDYYMVTKQMQTASNFEHCVGGGSCYWYTHKRGENIAIDLATAKIFDHGPLSANNVTTLSFSVGGGISGLTPSVSGTFGESWNQQDVSTTDLTDPQGNYAAWEDSFYFPNWDSPPNAIKLPWQNNQAVIYTVPAGTPSFNITVADWLHVYNNNGFSTSENYVNLDNFIPVGPPSLSVYPTTINVLPGQTASFDIAAVIPNNTGETLSWSISNVPPSMVVSPLTGTGSQVVQVTVPTGSPVGLATTLNIDTAQPYGAPDVRKGPLQVPVNVVSSTDIPAGVLITGGVDWNARPTNTAEVWDPSNGNSAVVGTMNDYRVFHTATTLYDGRVLLAGGLGHDLTTLNSTEFYNPATKTFTPGPNLLATRAYHTASLLPNGTVLFAGGDDDSGNALASAELFNPADNSIVAVGNMSHARMKHTALVLPNNSVMIAGGVPVYNATTGIEEFEIYNPTTKQFSSSEDNDTIIDGMVGQATATSALLTNGQIVIAAGQYGTLYVPFPQVAYWVNGFFIPGVQGIQMGNTAVNTPSPELIALPGGSAALLGQSFAQLLQPNTRMFAGNYPMAETRNVLTGVLLKNTNTNLDGNIVVAGGVAANTGSTYGTGIEVFNPSAKTWQRAGTMSTARSGHTLTLVGAATSSSSVSLSSSANPATTGQSVDFTVSVNTPGSYPEGSVTFYDDKTALATLDVTGGTANYSTSSLSIGTHNMTAVFSGNAFYSPATSPVVLQVINPIQVKPVFSNLTTPPVISYGKGTVTLSGTVAGPGPIYPPVNSSVQIVIQGVGQNARIGADGAFFINNFPTDTLNAGTYQIQYLFGGSPSLSPAIDTSTSLTINPLNPLFTNLTASQSIAYGTATVRLAGRIAAGQVIPTGNVLVSINNSSQQAPIATDGSFFTDFDTHLIPANTVPYTITYTYAATTNFVQANDVGTALTVQAVPTGTTVASSVTPSTLNQTVTFTATVKASSGTPTGTVTFIDGTTTLGTGTLTNGVATFSTDKLTAGTHQITAVYGGADGFGSSTSPAITQTVNKFTTDFSNLTASQSISYYTPTVTLSGAVSAGTNQYPAANEQVSVTIGTVTQYATIGTNGNFTINFPTQTISANTYKVQYSYPGNSTLASVSDTSKSLTINKITPVFSGLTPSQTIQAGTASITLAGKIAQGGAIPTGQVIATIKSVTGSGDIGTDGSFTINFDSSGLPGASTPYQIQYQYKGDTNFNTQGDVSTTLTVLLKAATTSVSSSPNPSTTGQSVLFTATVSATDGTPTGNVSFKDGVNLIGTGTLTNGTATYSPTSLTVGTHSITAVYMGDADYASSTSNPYTHTVNPVTPSFSGLTASQSITAGTASINLSGVISAPGPVYPATSEVVLVTIGKQSANAAIGSNGAFTVTFPTAALTPNTYPIGYTYNGNSALGKATDSSTSLTVTIAATSTALTSSLNPSTYGQPVTFTAKVTGPTGSTPDGTVSFNDGGTTLGTGTLTAGTATYTTGTLTAGAHSITAVYSGSEDFATSTSQAVAQTVNQAAAKFSGLSPSQSISSGTASISLSGIVSAPGPLYPAAGETVIITINQVPYKATIASAGAFSTSIPSAGLAAGSYPIAYNYPGDTNLASAGDSSTTLTVKSAFTTTALTSSLNPAPFGQPVTFTATVTSSGGSPTGTVVFHDGGAILGNGTLTNGVATYATNTLAAGSHAITAVYSGGAGMDGSTSAVVTQVVTSAGPIASRVTLTATPNPTADGDTVTFTATVPQDVVGIMPTGNITISEPLGANNVLIYGNANLVVGVATIVVTSSSAQTLSVGTHTLYATYGGDGVNYNGATSPAYTLTVNAK